VVKTSDIVEARGTALMVRERPMYGGEDIKSGDSIFIWSSGKGGRLVGRGRVTAVLDGQGDSVIGRGGDTLTLHLTDVDWGVRGSLTTQDLVPFRDLTSDGPMEVLARLLYRQAHNKIACLPEQAAALLAEMFEVQTSSAEVPAAPPATLLQAGNNWRFRLRRFDIGLARCEKYCSDRFYPPCRTIVGSCPDWPSDQSWNPFS